jgi:hypothetical protein
VNAKQPELLRIDTSSIAAVRAALPDLVYSVAVMKHVPHSELETYWRNILGLLGAGATAVVFADVADVEMRTAAKNWAYPQHVILALIKRILPHAHVEVETYGAPLDFGGKKFSPARYIISA